MPATPVVVRYADDLSRSAPPREQAEKVKQRLAQWLTPRGLNVRHYRSPGKLLITPAKAAVKRLRARLRSEVRSLHGANALAVISKLNPILRGWAAYYRTAVSKKVFNDINSTLVWTMLKWALRS